MNHPALKSRTAAYLMGAFILSTALQAALTFLMVHSHDEYLRNSERLRGKHVWESYIALLTSELRRAHQGYTWWTEVSLAIAQAGPNQGLDEELKNTWAAGNFNVNSLALILKDGILLEGGGTQVDFWKDTWSPREWWEQMESFRENTDLSRVAFIARENRLLLVMGAPSADDSGTPLGGGLVVFGLELDAERFSQVGALAGGTYLKRPGLLDLPLLNREERFALDYEPHLDLTPGYVTAGLSILVQMVLNGAILTVLLFLLRRARQQAQQSQRDLTGLRHSTDEAYQSLILTEEDVEQVQNFQNQVSLLRDRFLRFSEASHQVQTITAESSRKITQTADIIHTTRYRIQSIVDHIRFTSGNIKESVQQVQSVLGLIQELKGKIEAFENVAADLNQDALEGLVSIRDNLQRIESVGKASARIMEILHVIGDISQRTHLLAINAAIEASRAGQHGKGFSVVASEIRTLSDTVAANTQEIEQVVKDIVEKIANAVSSTQKLGALFERIADRSEENLQLTETIQALIHEQSTFSSQLVAQNNLMASIIEELEGAIHQNLLGLEEVERSLQSLRASVDHSASSVSELEARNRAIGELLTVIEALPHRLSQRLLDIRRSLEASSHRAVSG